MSELPELLAISDRQAPPEGEAGLLARLEQWLRRVQSGSLGLLIRDKDLQPAQRKTFARPLAELCHAHEAPVFVHGDRALAEDLGAKGLHLPSHASSGRPSFAGSWVGRSCHSLADLRKAESDALDYVLLSPVQPSPGKAKAGEELGWNGFESLATQVQIPIFALGGLVPGNFETARSKGAWGVAAIRGFWSKDANNGPAPKLPRRWTRGVSLVLAALIPFFSACQTQESSPEPTSPEAGDDDDSSPSPQDIERPKGDFALFCSDQEPNDLQIPPGSHTVPSPPWPEATNCGNVPQEAGLLLVSVEGEVSEITQGSWGGDSDAFVFEIDTELLARAILRWDPLEGDLDALLRCGDGVTFIDVFENDLASTAIPEQAEMSAAISAGTICYLLIVGYTGPVSQYMFWLEAI